MRTSRLILAAAAFTLAATPLSASAAVLDPASATEVTQEVATGFALASPGSIFQVQRYNSATPVYAALVMLKGGTVLSSCTATKNGGSFDLAGQINAYATQTGMPALATPCDGAAHQLLAFLLTGPGKYVVTANKKTLLTFTFSLSKPSPSPTGSATPTPTPTPTPTTPPAPAPVVCTLSDVFYTRTGAKVVMEIHTNSKCGGGSYLWKVTAGKRIVSGTAKSSKTVTKFTFTLDSRTLKALPGMLKISYRHVGQASQYNNTLLI